MKVTEILDRIQTPYSKGVASDDIRLSSRYIYSIMVTVRQALLSQQIKKKQKISDWNYTVLPCVELIKVPNHECECLGDLGCDVWRTKIPLPKILTDLNKHLIEFVMTVESSIKIEEVTRDSVRYLKGNKYTGSKPKWLLENSHLYFPLKKSPGIVKIKFLAEDPLEAMRYPSFCEDCVDCDNCLEYGDVEFPIDGDLLKPLIEMCQAEVLEKFAKGSEDRSNNALDNSNEK